MKNQKEIDAILDQIRAERAKVVKMFYEGEISKKAASLAISRIDIILTIASVARNLCEIFKGGPKNDENPPIRTPGPGPGIDKTI